MAVFSQSGRVSPQPPGKTRIGSQKTPTISEMPFSIVLSILGVYAISKAGLVMLTKVLAEEWGQYNIRANTIAPGLVKTRFSEALWDNRLIRENAEGDTALARVAEPEEMVGAALFLASDEKEK